MKVGRKSAVLALAFCSAATFVAPGCSHKTVTSYISAGDQAMHDAQLAEAERNYRQAVDMAPDDPRTHLALGNLYSFEQKPAQAQLEFMKALELDPKNPKAHLALANVYQQQSQTGLAEDQYRAAVVLNPLQADYRLALGTILRREGKLAEAEAQYRTAVGLEPKNAMAHFDLAELLAAQPNRSAEAQAEYAQARALNPNLSSPTPAVSAAAPTPAAPVQPKIKPLHKKFFLTKNSNVYASPDAASSVLAHVHRRGYVLVIGITRDWLQIRLRSGTVGFIPVSAAE